MLTASAGGQAGVGGLTSSTAGVRGASTPPTTRSSRLRRSRRPAVRSPTDAAAVPACLRVSGQALHSTTDLETPLELPI